MGWQYLDTANWMLLIGFGKLKIFGFGSGERKNQNEEQQGVSPVLILLHEMSVKDAGPKYTDR
jgi:hypothetical protein